jgi:hypothetical protein
MIASACIQQKTPLPTVLLLLLGISVGIDCAENITFHSYPIVACYIAVIWQQLFLLASQFWPLTDLSQYVHAVLSHYLEACSQPHDRNVPVRTLQHRLKKCQLSVAFSLQANYTDWATATCRRNLVPTFVDRGVSCGQRGGSPTVVITIFLDRSRYFSFK